jgi:hypothetical protein
MTFVSGNHEIGTCRSTLNLCSIVIYMNDNDKMCCRKEPFIMRKIKSFIISLCERSYRTYKQIYCSNFSSSLQNIKLKNNTT